MRQDQFRNWLDFSTRMAREARPAMNGTRKAALVRLVERLVRDSAEYGLAAITAWDEAPYPCDFFEKWLEAEGHLRWDESRQERVGEFGTLAMCCIHAGFDVAVSPSAGVVGPEFNVGMLRRMYPQGIPDFVAAQIGEEAVRAPDAQPVWL